MSTVLERPRSPRPGTGLVTGSPGSTRAATPMWAYAGAVILGLLLMEIVSGAAYAAIVASATLLLFLLVQATGDTERRTTLIHRHADRRDLIAIGIIYLLVTAFYRVAFVVIDDNDMLLFLSFAAGLLIGVVGPIYYTVWRRNRSLATIGLTTKDLPRVALLALIFAAVQFAITLWGYHLPGTRGWVTLLGMALMVGIFESIFFRGFVQGRLQDSLGVAPAVFGAAFLYGAYHVGYGMGFEEIVFLSGLGVVYALAYLTVENVLVLWPLLTPLGNLFAQLEDGQLTDRLPWASLLGFADVIGLFALAIWLAHRHERKHRPGPVLAAGD